MKKPPTDPDREDRIRNEALVDAYGPEEVATSWYYYLEGNISFPFQARCTHSCPTSPLRKGETVEVVGLAADEVCENDMLVRIRWSAGKDTAGKQTVRNLVVPLSQLAPINPDEETAEAVSDWHYWVARGYLF